MGQVATAQKKKKKKWSALFFLSLGIIINLPDGFFFLPPIDLKSCVALLGGERRRSHGRWLRLRRGGEKGTPGEDRDTNLIANRCRMRWGKGIQAFRGRGGYYDATAPHSFSRYEGKAANLVWGKDSSYKKKKS